jgi:prolipoprotein diacylglyceryltransferase
LVEFFKEVQQPFEKTLVLDMGQILSIPPIILGFIALWYSNKQQEVEKYEPEIIEKVEQEIINNNQ